MKPSNYEPILKEPLVCFRCNSEMKNVPILKNHLQEDWDKLAQRAKLVNARKRNLPNPTSEASSSISVDHHDVDSDKLLDEAVEPKEKRARTEGPESS